MLQEAPSFERADPVAGAQKALAPLARLDEGSLDLAQARLAAVAHHAGELPCGPKEPRGVKRHRLPHCSWQEPLEAEP